MNSYRTIINQIKMKKILLVAFVFVGTLANAQTLVKENTQSQLSVTGEGKVMVVPDEAKITIGVENSGADATDVKKKNDATVDAVIKYLKSIKLPEKDYQTKRVFLNRNQDYKTGKYSYTASQTITIHLKDLTKYNTIMEGLVGAGINTVQGVEFLSSKFEQHQSEARVKAVQDAKRKAQDYAGALGQKLGKALLVSDNSQNNYVPVMRAAMFDMSAGGESASRETLAIGEITVTANVVINFLLE